MTTQNDFELARLRALSATTRRALEALTTELDSDMGAAFGTRLLGRQMRELVAGLSEPQDPLTFSAALKSRLDLLAGDVLANAVVPDSAKLEVRLLIVFFENLLSDRLVLNIAKIEEPALL